MLDITSLSVSNRPFDHQVALQQVGRMTVAAISGGRVHREGGALVLPVGCGYSVRITLAANDTYTIERVFRRGIGITIRRVTDVHADELSDTAYEASNFRTSRSWGELVTA